MSCQAKRENEGPWTGCLCALIAQNHEPTKLACDDFNIGYDNMGHELSYDALKYFFIGLSKKECGLMQAPSKLRRHSIHTCDQKWESEATKWQIDAWNIYNWRLIGAMWLKNGIIQSADIDQVLTSKLKIFISETMRRRNPACRVKMRRDFNTILFTIEKLRGRMPVPISITVVARQRWRSWLISMVAIKLVDVLSAQWLLQ